MTRDEIQKLLGGYATGTLTAAEQQALFEAALSDQELFDTLAREQSLRDLLRDPAARAHLLASIEDRPQPRWKFGFRWVLAGATLAACLAAAGVYWIRTRPAPHPVLVAMDTRVEPPRPKLQASAPAPASPLPSTNASALASPSAATVRAPLQRHKAAAALRDTTVASPVSPTTGNEPAAAAPAAAPVPPPNAVGGLGGAGGGGARPAPAFRALSGATPQTATPDLQFDATRAKDELLVAGSQSVSLNGALEGELKTQNARSLFYAQPGSQFLPSASVPPATPPKAQFGAMAGVGGVLTVPNLGVKWTVLRKAENGLFDEVDSEQIQAGDTIKLRLVPNDNGFLSVLDGAKPLVQRQRVERLQPFTTPEITSGAGKKELIVTLTRQLPSPPVNLVRAASADQLSTVDQAEHAVYEVKTGNNALAPVMVKVTLNFR